jgi:DNA repair photolyase
LVTDGRHIEEIRLFPNYPQRLAASLARNSSESLFYYFSPKSEAFSEPHLFSGLAHEILRTFITHYDRFPDSKVRLFVATKAGCRHLEVRHNGASIFDLISRFPSKVQINSSIGIMPLYLRSLLEPHAAGVTERLELLVRLQQMGVWADSVLCQPLFLPYINEEGVAESLSQFALAGVKNIKPEFFTAEIRNIVLVAQYIHHFDPQKTGSFFYPYLMESNLRHLKQRSRLAPNRAACVEKLEIIHNIAKQFGVSLSICNWVKRELGGVAEWVRSIDTASAARGYRCLGYQTSLL